MPTTTDLPVGTPTEYTFRWDSQIIADRKLKLRGEVLERRSCGSLLILTPKNELRWVPSEVTKVTKHQRKKVSRKETK